MDVFTSRTEIHMSKTYLYKNGYIHKMYMSFILKTLTIFKSLHSGQLLSLNRNQTLHSSVKTAAPFDSYRPKFTHAYIQVNRLSVPTNSDC